jgi:hypothetical protein
LNNKAKYIKFCNENANIPLFHQPWWLEIVSNGNWDVVLSNDRNGNITAALPYTWAEKYFKLLSLQPVLTPYLGIIYFYPPDIIKRTSKYSFENEHANNIIRDFPGKFMYLYHNFTIDFKNWFSFFNKGYIQTTRYTYILENIKDRESLWSGFTNTLKRQIKIAENHYSIHESEDVLLVFSFMKKSLKAQKVKWFLTDDLILKLDKELSKRRLRKILVAKDKEGQPISAMYLCWDNSKAYLLALGLNKDENDSNSVKYLIWEGIKKASVYVDVFDFEGSMLPGVERLYRSYGAEMTPYFVLKKYKNKLVRLLLNFIDK